MLGSRQRPVSGCTIPRIFAPKEGYVLFCTPNHAETLPRHLCVNCANLSSSFLPWILRLLVLLRLGIVSVLFNARAFPPEVTLQRRAISSFVVQSTALSVSPSVIFSGFALLHLGYVDHVTTAGSLGHPLMCDNQTTEPQAPPPHHFQQYNGSTVAMIAQTYYTCM